MKTLTLVSQTTQNLKDFTDAHYAQASFCFHTLLKNKEIKVNGKKVNQNVSLFAGDTVQYFLTDKQAEREAFYVVYRDEDILVIDKDSGVNSEAVYADLLRQYGEECRFIHRLDRNTKGLMLFALAQEIEDVLLSAFKEKRIEKIYHALCVGTLDKPSAVCKAYLKKDEQKSFVQIFDEKVKDSQEIITEYSLLENKDGLSKVEITLHTGKTHQIRAHMAHLGCPVLGDMKYGNEVENKRRNITRQALVAKRLCLHLEGACARLNGKNFVSRFDV